MIYSSKVITGRGRGKKIGFPTLNLEIPEFFTKKYGVYAAHVWIKGDEFRGALFFGLPLTFHESAPTLEIFVIDYNSNEDIKSIDFDLLRYLRPIVKFETEDELSAQIAEDVKDIREIDERTGDHPTI